MFFFSGDLILFIYSFCIAVFLIVIFSCLLSFLNADRDDPVQLLESFKSLADEKDSISAAQLNVPPLNEEDAKFLLAHMQDKGNGQYDYAAYINASFNAHE